MNGINFDVDGARQAGFTDDQIADRLAKEVGFDAAAARNAGFGSDQIIARLVQPAPAAPELPPVEVPGVGETMLIGAGRTFDRIGKGAQQVYYGLTGDEQAAADLKARADDDERIYSRLREKRPIATGFGEALPTMAVPIGSTATLPMTLAKLGAAGAAPELLKYGSAEERAKNAAVSGAFSAGAGVALPAAGRALKTGAVNTMKSVFGDVTPAAAQLYQKAKAFGIPVNMAQLGDSKFAKTLASMLEQLPFTGAHRSNAAQNKAYTRAISNTFGDNVDSITSDVYRANRDRLGRTFQALSDRNSLKVTPEVLQQFDSILDDAAKFANADTEAAVKKIIAQYTSRVQGGPVQPVVSSLVDPSGIPIIMSPGRHVPTEIPGKAYQSLDSHLGKLMKTGGEKSVYLAKIQEVARNAMDDSITPADKAAWDTARQQYRNLKLVRDVISRDGGSGDITPMALMTALNRSEAGKEAMARGVSGDVGDLAKIGKQFIRDPIPNSGTIQRGISMGLLGGGGIAFGVDPMTMGGLMVGSATTGRALNKMMYHPKAIESMMSPRASMKDVFLANPSLYQQVIGSGAGMTAANVNRE